MIIIVITTITTTTTTMTTTTTRPTAFRIVSDGIFSDSVSEPIQLSKRKQL